MQRAHQINAVNTQKFHFRKFLAPICDQFVPTPTPSPPLPTINANSPSILGVLKEENSTDSLEDMNGR